MVRMARVMTRRRKRMRTFGNLNHRYIEINKSSNGLLQHTVHFPTSLNPHNGSPHLSLTYSQIC